MRFSSLFAALIGCLLLIACSNNIKPYTQSVDLQASDQPPAGILATIDQTKVADLTPVQLSQALLYYLKEGRSVAEIKERYQSLVPAELTAALDSDPKRKAFWINTYNGFIQEVLMRQPDLYKDRNEFFKLKQLAIAGQALSFDNIEHGIIRDGRAKLSAGYLPDILDSDFEEMMSTMDVDPRIHFAVNCGAKDCPPVHMLDGTTLNAQLDALTKTYLTKTTKHDTDAGTVTVSPLMNWFRGDFGGKNSVNDFLKAYEIIPATVKPSVEYGDYDWTLALNTYAF